MQDKIVDSRRFFNEICLAISMHKKINDSLVIKYREASQVLVFPCSCETIVGGKKGVLDLCDEDTIVIGPPGSALLECQLHEVPFYSYWRYESYKDNQFLSSKSVDNLQSIIYIAKNNIELIFNMANSKIYKDGYSKSDLIYGNGLRLNEVVKTILEGD